VILPIRASKVGLERNVTYAVAVAELGAGNFRPMRESHALPRSGDVMTNCQGMCSDSRERTRSCQGNPRHPSLGFQKKGCVYTVEVGLSYRAIARERNGEILMVSGSERTKSTIASGSD